MWLPEFQGVIDRAGARLGKTTLELTVDDPQGVHRQVVMDTLGPSTMTMHVAAS